MKNELTPWFNDCTEPVRNGWYETKYYYFGSAPIKRYFKNGKWMNKFYPNAEAITQSYFWRGIVK